MNPEIIEIVRKESNALFQEVNEIRKHLHRNPELSYEEHETMKFVASKLSDYGITYTSEVAKTGIVALIHGKQHTNSDSCIGLRADLDALPILEENTTDYISKNKGVMHACGHDVHTAILLGTAKILHNLRNQLPQPVKLIFQPGEEKNPGGASLMIKAGVLENPKVQEMYALHVFPDLPAGEVGFKEGLYMASCDEIYIDIEGIGGHAATPHKTVDSILIGAEIVTSLQQIVSRKCDPTIPCVLSFGHFEALGATNVIPSHAHLKGTFRTMNESWRAEALEQIVHQAEKIALAHGGKATVTISKGYPFLENDTTLTQTIRKKAVDLLGSENVHELPLRLTSEDFSFYSQTIPTCFFRLGVRNEEKGIVHGVHHPRFDIDEKALITGMQMMSLAVFK
ncbi:MAG: M20 metallopeptidase family protein [Lishizhenia sp.]